MANSLQDGDKLIKDHPIVKHEKVKDFKCGWGWDHYTPCWHYVDFNDDRGYRTMAYEIQSAIIGTDLAGNPTVLITV